MKTIIRILYIWAFISLVAGCGKDEVMGERPPCTQFCLLVEDAGTGADLLNPETEGNLLNDRVCAIENGKKHYIENLPGSKFVPSALSWLFPALNSEKYRFLYDYIPYYRVTTVIFDWGDGTKTRVDCLPQDSPADSMIWIDGVPMFGMTGIVRK